MTKPDLDDEPGFFTNLKGASAVYGCGCVVVGFIVLALIGAGTVIGWL